LGLRGTREERRKLRDQKLPYLHPVTNIVRDIILRRMRWVGHVASKGERKGAYRVLLGNPRGEGTIWKT